MLAMILKTVVTGIHTKMLGIFFTCNLIIPCKIPKKVRVGAENQRCSFPSRNSGKETTYMISGSFCKTWPTTIVVCCDIVAPCKIPSSVNISFP